jgi:hypothetical protein
MLYGRGELVTRDRYPVTNDFCSPLNRQIDRRVKPQKARVLDRVFPFKGKIFKVETEGKPC